MRSTSTASLFLFALLAVVAACGGGSATPSPTSSPVIACAAGNAAPVLLYPAPGSTGAPDGNFDVWVGYPQNPSSAFSGPKLDATGQQEVTGPAWLPPSPSPSMPPGIAPLPSGDQYWISGIGALAAATTYSVSLASPCIDVPLGSFTTQ